MKIMAANSTGLQQAVKALQQGGIVAHATETCYGLACDVSNPVAVQNLFTIKQRDASKPVSALFESVESTKKYVIWNTQAEEFAADTLPGPYTLILPLRTNTLYPTPTGGETIGVRISSYPIAQQLVAMFGKPISTTSANIANRPTAYCVQELVNQGLEVDIVLDSGTLDENPSSTVLDFSDGSGRILR